MRHQNTGCTGVQGGGNILARQATYPDQRRKTGDIGRPDHIGHHRVVDRAVFSVDAQEIRTGAGDDLGGHG